MIKPHGRLAVMTKQPSGTTHTLVAGIAGLSIAAVSRIRSGQRTPSWPTIRKIELGFSWDAAAQAGAIANGTYVREFEAVISDHAAKYFTPEDAQTPGPV